MLRSVFEIFLGSPEQAGGVAPILASRDAPSATVDTAGLDGAASSCSWCSGTGMLLDTDAQEWVCFCKNGNWGDIAVVVDEAYLPLPVGEGA